MSHKRKEFFAFLAIVVVVNMITSMFLPTASVLAATTSKGNSNIEVKITSDKKTVESGNQITFNLEYKVVGGQGSIKEGDVLEFKLPDEFSNIKPKYPPEHFKDVEVHGTTVRAIFSKGVETAIAGYMSIVATAKNVNNNTPARVEVNVNGTTQYLDVEVTPKPEDPNTDPNPNPNPADRQLLKSVENAIGWEGNKMLANIAKPVVGKSTKYTIYINEKYAPMHNVSLDDTMPEGTGLLKDSIKIYEIPYGGSAKDVTKDMINKMNISSNRLYLYLDYTDKQYRIEYSAKYNTEYPQYINTAKLSQYGKDTINSSTIVKPIVDDRMISKSYRSENEIKDKDGRSTFVVSKIGDIVDYTVDVNPNNASIKNAIFEDNFPKGMQLVDGSVQVGEKDISGNFKWITDSIKGNISTTNNKMTINLGDTNKHYYIYYKLKVTDRYKEYNNNAKISYDGTSQEVNSEINYEMNAGAINAQKLVDKTEIKKGEDQIVTYTINFDCYGYFNQNYLSLVDNLDSRLKIVGVEVPKEFTAKVADGNKVTVVNDKGSIDYGQKLQVKIKADFSNIPDGTTIRNVAKIDKATTNEVTTKKGYVFEVRKIDSYTKEALKGAKFELLDSNKNLIDTVTSDSEGNIKHNVDAPGDYYLKEVEAPKGYVLDTSEKKFTIKDSDIGTVVNIGNLENNIKTGSVNLTKEDSETAQKLEGAEFKLYSKDDKEIGTYTTNKDGSIEVKDLRPGSYYFLETKAPEGYDIDNSKHEFTIALGGTETPINLVVKNNIKKGEAVLIKEDADTGEKLQGAVYGLYDSSDKLIEQITTDENGKAMVSSKLRPGTYYFKEITAPKGYNLSDEKIPVEIRTGGIANPESVIAKDSIMLGSVKLIKVDSKTGGKLKGAVYGIYDADNNLVDKVTTGDNGEVTTTDLRPGKYYFKEITAPVGYEVNEAKYPFEIILGQTSQIQEITASDNIILGSVNLIKEDSETSQKLGGAEFDLYKVNNDSTNGLVRLIKSLFKSNDEKIGTYTTDENGQISVKDLRPGNYYFVEIKAPEGYELDNSKHEFEVVLGKAENAIQLVAKNNIKKGEAILVKEDSKTGEKLQGAIYGLYDSSDKLIEQVTTDENGQAIVGTKLRPGNYYFKEIKAPNGYNISDEKIPVEIKTGGIADPEKAIAKDSVILGSAKLIKVDSKTGGKLKGAVYGIYDADNNLVDKVTTGDNGEVRATDLRPGKYYFREITAPFGYELNQAKYPFEIILGETSKAPEITANDDVILGSAKLIKTDSKTGEKLQGAVYGVYNSDNELVEKVTTGDNGETTATNLRPGKYYFKEIQAPLGYALSQTQYPFEIILGERSKVPEITANDDMLLGSVNLIKEDSETAQKLEGAEFKLYSQDNTEIGIYTTDKNGSIEVKDLRAGTYYFVETKAPEGYALDASKHEFKIVLGKTDTPIQLTVKNNIKKGEAILVKEDSKTGEKLQGAIYGIYDSSDTLIEKVTTDEDGKAVVSSKLRPGSYYFKEITAPKGYNISDEKIPVEIKIGGIADPEITVARDSVILGSAKLIKVDSKTGGKLKGAVYGIYDADNNLVDKVTTGDNGEVTATDLRPGKYYFREITAPFGYELNQAKYPFEIILGETSKVPEVTANDDILLGSVNLIKEDSETAQRLEGAEFDLYKVNDKSTNSNSIIRAISDFITPDSSKIGTYTTDENGAISVKDLRPGNYYFVETKSPIGYELDSSKHEFKVTLGETNTPIQLTVNNNIKKGEAILVKEDSKTGEKLQGAIYGIYDSSDKLIEKVTTDENGQAIVSTKLRPGNYYFKEIQAPNGYNISDEKIPVEIKAGGISARESVIAKDSVILGSAKLIKVDSKTGGKLKGAVYGIYDADNNLVDKVTTGDNGEVTATDLRPGKYYFKEITAPIGYELSKTKYPFEIILGETSKVPEVTASNDVILGSAKLIKVDSETGEQLEGAVYGIYDTDNNLVDKVTTKNNGEVTATNLRPGKYYFKEIKAPIGYALSQTKYPFEIILGETSKVPEVTVKNDILLGSVNLTKEDSETSKRLEGAEFKLYSKDNKNLGTYTTDKNGSLEVKNLRPGTYYFIETKAPNGYVLDSSKHEFKIVLGKTEEATKLVIKNDIEKGEAILVKEDSDNGERLKGAIYGLYDSSDNLIEKVTTNENGKAIVSTKLRPGKYYFKEIQAPNGYNISNEKISVEINTGGAVNPEVAIAKDNVILGSAKLIKIDSKTGGKLKGAVYGIYDEDNNLVEKVTTGDNGEVTATDLRPGKYYFREITAPFGYELSQTKYPFEIILGETSKVPEITANDDILLGSVNLIKEDSETSQKLGGAEFDLYKVNDKSTNSNSIIRAISDLITPDSSNIGTYTTDENGSISVKDLRPGDYYFVETKAPVGYELDNSKHEFKITLGKTESPMELVVKNTKIKEDKPKEEDPKENDDPKDNNNKPNTNDKIDKPKDKETIDNSKKDIIPKTGYEMKYLYAFIIIAVGIMLLILAKKRNRK
ncbi:SpaA isopeptide-forming pilin-related protein [Clostridium sardiniense]|uniref:SpaA isopeptide-forming pilin-related protein n=1 Tax=Clostridium sardiniense TaxID=29369 RepID=UPI003D34497E